MQTHVLDDQQVQSPRQGVMWSGKENWKLGSAQPFLAAATSDHRLGALNNTQLLLSVLAAGESKVKVPTDLLPGEDLSPHLQTAVSLLCRHIAEGREGRGRETKLFRLFVKALISFTGATLVTQSPPKGPSHGRLGFQREFGGTQTFSPKPQGKTIVYPLPFR